MDASIVIPTKNAGEQFRHVLEAVFGQKTDYEYEVICVDSGSSDCTLEIIKEFPCRLYEIAPSDFGHGKTRNFGASKGTGEYVVFITQDALPANGQWLNNLISSMHCDKNIAGAFGIHYPYPDCNIFDKRDINSLFESFGTENTVMKIDDPERWKKDEDYMHTLCFFSDNNSCVKRSILQKHPYPDVDFAEDQIWMKQMMELGYKKCYCPTAPVFHSHNYVGKELSKRYYDDHKGLYEIHGYQIATNRRDLLKLFRALTISDFHYIRGLELSRKEKLHQLKIATSRNWRRCNAGYLGSSYHSFSERRKRKLDKKMSQQKAQREA